MEVVLGLWCEGSAFLPRPSKYWQRLTSVELRRLRRGALCWGKPETPAHPPGRFGGITMGGFTQTPPTRAEQVSLKTDRAWQSRRGLGLSRKGEKDEKNP